MGYADCRNWDYNDHPQRNLVTRRSEKLIELLRARPGRFDRYGLCTKRGHVFLFTGMAPATCQYLVGNYRGAEFPCLKNYCVGVGNDARVGVPPAYVVPYLGLFESTLSSALKKFEAETRLKPQRTPPPILLAQFVSIVANFLQMFLTIHPYANGNGHMGRLLVWVLLGRFGYWPVQWPLDTSPNYHQALSAHRDGNKVPLENFILKCIIGP